MDAIQWLEHMEERQHLILEANEQANEAEQAALEAARNSAKKHCWEAFEVMIGSIGLEAEDCNPQMQTSKVTSQMLDNNRNYPEIESMSYVITVGKWRISADTAQVNFDAHRFEVNHFTIGSVKFGGSKSAKFSLYFRRLDDDMPEIPNSYPEEPAPPAYDRADLAFRVVVDIPCDITDDGFSIENLCADGDTLDHIAEMMLLVEEVLTDWQADLDKWKANYRG